MVKYYRDTLLTLVKKKTEFKIWNTLIEYMQSNITL